MDVKMEIPSPDRVVNDGGSTAQEGATDKTLAQRLATLGKLDVFAPMTDAEQRALATELADCMYVRNDVISRQGEVAEALYVLAAGEVGIYGGAHPGSREGGPPPAPPPAPAYFR